MDGVEGVRRNVERWNASVARTERLQHVAEQLVGVVELLVELVDAAVQPGALVEAQRLEHLGEPVDEFVAGAGEPLRVSAGEKVAEVRGLLADLRSLVHQPIPVKEGQS